MIARTDPMRVFAQVRPWDKPVGELTFTSTQTLDDPVFTDAIGRLNAARTRLGVKSACEVNPSLWDGIGFEEDEPPLHEKAQNAIKAIALCEVCPVLTECESVFLASWESASATPEGVIAGVWLDSTEEGGYITQYLGTGEWPEEALKMTRGMSQDGAQPSPK